MRREPSSPANQTYIMLVSAAVRPRIINDGATMDGRGGPDRAGLGSILFFVCVLFDVYKNEDKNDGRGSHGASRH